MGTRSDCAGRSKSKVNRNLPSCCGSINLAEGDGALPSMRSPIYSVLEDGLCLQWLQGRGFGAPTWNSTRR
jgi:hypothetical protein